MTHSVVAADLQSLVWLLVLAVGVRIASRRLDLPYTVALAAVGFVLGIMQIHGSFVLSRDLIVLVFLPALLFQAAIEIPWEGVRTNLVPLLALAMGGVLFSTLLVGAVLHVVSGVPLAVTLVFAAIVSATDPVAVVALFRELGLAPRLTLIIEAESLFNDGLSAALYLVIVSVALGSAASPVASAGLFVVQSAGGVLVGAGLGFIMSRITGHITDLHIETALTVVLAYSAYIIASSLAVSGMLSVVAAGMVVGNYGLPQRMHPEVGTGVKQFWEFVAFLGNSILFLLIGLAAGGAASHTRWVPAFLLAVLVLASRTAMVYLLLGLTGLRSEGISRRWKLVLSWGGLRGAVAMALALGLPPTLPHRGEIQAWVFGTTLISLLIQGAGIKPLVRWLRVHNE